LTGNTISAIVVYMIDTAKWRNLVYKDPQPEWPFTHQERQRDPLTAFLRSPAIAALRASPAPLDERGACELLIQFANEGGLSPDHWREFLGARAPTDRAVSGQVNLLQDQLGQLVEHPEKAGHVLGPWWADELQRNGAVTLPVCSFDDGALRIGHQIVARNIAAACAYAMCLLLDRNRPHGAALCRCRVCATFFFELPAARGKGRRFYCSAECARDSHRAQIREAVRQHRAAKKAKRPRR
jgi:hypothetical protein